MKTKPTLLFDFSNTILFAKSPAQSGSLNHLHSSQQANQDYQFLDYFYFNEPLLTFLQNHQDQFTAHIFTTGRIQEAPEVRTRIKPLFNRIFTVADINIPKTDPEVYKYIAQEINSNPANITFVDDSQANTHAAALAGLQIIHYNMTPEELVNQLHKIISKGRT